MTAEVAKGDVSNVTYYTIHFSTAFQLVTFTCLLLLLFPVIAFAYFMIIVLTLFALAFLLTFFIKL